jgi:hypothetical protein
MSQPFAPKFRALAMGSFVLIATFAGVSLALDDEDAPPPTAPRTGAEQDRAPLGPPSDVEQLPRRMHQAMDVRPRIRVGTRPGEGNDLIGSDHRALQAAVDYIAALGGGTVEIGPGTFTMRDSLHLRSGVTVKGAGGETILRKAPSVRSRLRLDGDYGEEQVSVENATGFEVGDGVAVTDDHSGGFHTTVARITGKSGNTFSISRPLNADCMVGQNARAATVFPVISGYDCDGGDESDGIVLESLTIEGSKDTNEHLNGCRGAGIFLYRAHGAVLRRCHVRDYAGDGISFQQSNDVQVIECVSENNTHLGLHPGSGSQRPRVIGSTANGNGEDGLFLCWRVRHGVFEGNRLVGNGRFGISIGHKDTDNLIARNFVGENGHDGIFFRNESEGMAGHRNRILENVVENNGASSPSAGIRIRGATHDVIIRGNTIRDTRSGSVATQKAAIRIDAEVGDVTIEDNAIGTEVEIDDRREKPKPK